MMQSGISVMPYMMDPGEDKIIADALYAALTNPGEYKNPVIPTGTPADVNGTWGVTIAYPRGTGEQKFTLQQSGNDLTGTQAGEIYNATFKGAVHANEIELHSAMPVPGNTVVWTFKGNVTGNEITGTVNMGEYGNATWKALRV
jgi:hypothetical protein